MDAIRIRQRLESETIHLPDVAPLIGREVEIIVRATSAPSDGADRTRIPAVPQNLTLAALAAAQGVQPVERFEDVLGPGEGADFEGFDEWLEEQRRNNIVPEFKEP
jgi:hypothetical protein